MQIMCQLFNTKTGQRTEAMSVERSDLAINLQQTADKHSIPTEDIIVIVLMEKTPVSPEWQFTLAPLYRGDDFIKFFGA